MLTNVKSKKKNQNQSIYETFQKHPVTALQTNTYIYKLRLTDMKKLNIS